MTHIRIRIFIFTLVLAAMFLMVTTPGFAEIYKYVDQNGIVHFTDNLSTVPESYRDQLERNYEIPQPWPPENRPADIDTADSNGNTTGSLDPARPQAGSPSAEGAVSGVQQGKTAEELAQKRNALMKKKAQLNQEYQSLLKQRRELEAEHETLETPEAVDDYNQKVQELNDKIQEYREKRSDLEMEIQEFNATLSPPEQITE